MNEGYLRQRRNLISASIVILLVVLGGTKTNHLYPFQFERPYIAELFMWIGFSYFWYRTKIYSPTQIIHLFRTEIIISHIQEYNYKTFNMYNLSSFNGIAEITREQENGTLFKLIGVVELSGKTVDSNMSVPLPLKEILNLKTFLKNLIVGKVITDFYLPRILAVTTLSVGVYKYQEFFPEPLFYYGAIILVAYLLSTPSYLNQKIKEL